MFNLVVMLNMFNFGMIYGGRSKSLWSSCLNIESEFVFLTVDGRLFQTAAPEKERVVLEKSLRDLGIMNSFLCAVWRDFCLLKSLHKYGGSFSLWILYIITALLNLRCSFKGSSPTLNIL